MKALKRYLIPIIDQGIFFVFINQIEINISESIHIISQLVNYSAQSIKVFFAVTGIYMFRYILRLQGYTESEMALNFVKGRGLESQAVATLDHLFAAF